MTDPEFTIPDQSDIRDPTLEVNPKKLQAWLHELPFGDVAAATRMVFDTLKRLNRTHLAAKLRFDLLELYWSALEQITRSLARHYAGQLQPMPEANRKIAESMRKLHGEYADGYKIAVLSQRGARQDWSRPNPFTTSLFRALDLLGKVQLISHQAYLAPLGKVWLEIHRIYHYARNQGTERVAAPDPDQPGQPGTVEEKYKTILLTDLTDPYRLEAGQIPHLVQYLREHIALARVLRADAVREDEGDNRPALFAVRFDYDTGAAAYGDLVVAEHRHGLLLDASELLRGATQHLQLLDQQQGPSDADQMESRLTLRYLISSLGVRPERRHERLQITGEMEVARGIAATAWVLNGRQSFILPASEEDEVIELNSDGQPGQDASTASYETDCWEKVNYSEAGLALLRTNSAKARVKIGDLLGLRDQAQPDRPEAWGLAVVKRFRYHDDGSLLVGVQVLAPGARLVALRRNGSASRAAYRQALLLAANKQSGVGPALLTQRGYFRPGAAYQVDQAGKKLNLVAKQLVELSPGFDHFAFDQA